MEGGDLHWIWTGYEIYEKVDYVRPLGFPFAGRRGRLLTPLQIYGVKAFQEGDGFPTAQCPHSPDHWRRKTF